MRPVAKVIAGCVAVVAALFVAAWASGTSVRPAPAQIPGYLTATIPMAHRDGEVTLHIWYPAASSQVVPVLIGQNALFYGHHVRPGAAILPGRHPVVALSHGSGGNAVALGWLAGRLAVAGHVVVAPNHPGTTSGDSDPERTTRIWERAEDVSAALDALGDLLPEADTKRVAAVGFSLGGHTAMAVSGARVSKAAFIAYCDRWPDVIDCGWMNAAGVDFAAIDATRYEADLSDPRIRATVAIDAALPRAMTPDSLAAMRAPALVINMGRPGDIPEGLRLDDIAALMPDATYLPLPDTWHFHMLAACSLLGRAIIGAMGDDNICSDMGLRDRREVHAAVLAAAVPFLHAALAPP